VFACKLHKRFVELPLLPALRLQDENFNVVVVRSECLSGRWGQVRARTGKTTKCFFKGCVDRKETVHVALGLVELAAVALVEQRGDLFLGRNQLSVPRLKVIALAIDVTTNRHVLSKL
jgi:hypothetical protein